MFDKVMSLFWGIGLLTWIVGLGTLLAGIVGVSNIMLVLVKERTQEIGIRRALGAPPTAIISQILSESFILTFIAGVVGLTAAVGVLSVADSVYYQAVTVAQEGFEVSWQISFGTGMLALFILDRGQPAGGRHPRLPGPEHQGGGCNTRRINDQIQIDYGYEKISENLSGCALCGAACSERSGSCGRRPVR